MLTPRGVVLLVSAVMVWLAGRSFGIAELYAVAVGCAAVVGLGTLFVRQATSAIAVRRRLDADRVVAGARVEAHLEMRNDARVVSPSLLLSEELPESFWAADQPDPGVARFVLRGLGPGRVASAGYAADANTRGRYLLGPLSVRLRDPFGVAERTKRYESVGDLLVYPRIERLNEQKVGGSHMGAGSSDKRRVLASGDEFYTMREYVRGDDLRHIHWPSTAHRSKLMVRQMEQPWQAHATLYLDTRAASHTLDPEGSLERAVSVAASLVYHLADRGYAIRLVTDADTGRGGPQPWQASLDALAVLQASSNAGLGPSAASTRGGEGLFIAVLGTPPGKTDPSVHPDMRALYGVRGFGQRIAIFCTHASRRDRAQRSAHLMTAAGWRTEILLPDGDLPHVWNTVMRPRSRASALS